MRHADESLERPKLVSLPGSVPGVFRIGQAGKHIADVFRDQRHFLEDFLTEMESREKHLQLLVQACKCGKKLVPSPGI